MLIERLVLRNFKRFGDAEIRFRDGINGIIGNNGTGKSSIVEAILFALFGVQGTGVQSDFIVSSFAGERAKCEVRLDFQVQGVRYAITRTFRKGGQTVHEARLNMGEKLLASGVSEVAGEVGRLCGMGPTDFKNTVYAAQKDLPALLESRPGARKEWFMQVLGIERLRLGSDGRMKEWIDEAEKAVEREKNRLAVLSGQGDVAEIPALEEELGEIGRALAGRERERRRLGEVDSLLRESASLAQSDAALAERLQQAETELLRLSAARERLEELSPALRRFGELGEELARLKEKEERFEELRERRGRADAAIQAGKRGCSTSPTRSMHTLARPGSSQPCRAHQNSLRRHGRQLQNSTGPLSSGSRSPAWLPRRRGLHFRYANTKRKSGNSSGNRQRGEPCRRGSSNSRPGAGRLGKNTTGWPSVQRPSRRREQACLLTGSESAPPAGRVPVPSATRPSGTSTPTSSRSIRTALPGQARNLHLSPAPSLPAGRRRGA